MCKKKNTYLNLDLNLYKTVRSWAKLSQGPGLELTLKKFSHGGWSKGNMLYLDLKIETRYNFPIWALWS